MKRDYEVLAEQKEDAARLKKLYVEARRGRWMWPARGAAFGLVGCVIAIILGVTLLTIAWVAGDESAGLSLHGIGNILLISTIPLLILGACCLDLLEKRTEKNEPPNGGGRVRRADDAPKASARKLLLDFAGQAPAQRLLVERGKGTAHEKANS